MKHIDNIVKDPKECRHEWQLDWAKGEPKDGPYTGLVLHWFCGPCLSHAERGIDLAYYLPEPQDIWVKEVAA